MPNLWVYYKYERFQSLCYKCGIIGHDMKNCKNQQAMSSVDPARPKYGLEISVNAPRSLLFLGKSQYPQQNQQSSNSTAEVNPNDEAYNRHYRNMAISLQAKPMLSAEEVRNIYGLPDLNFSAVPAEIQSQKQTYSKVIEFS